VHQVEGVAAVNALAFDGEGNLCIASDDGAYIAAPGERARRLERGPFSAVAVVNGKAWFASRGGVFRLDEGGLTRWGAEQGLRAEQPTSIAPCGEKICIGASDGLWEVPADGGPATRRSSEADGLPAAFVTAVASGSNSGDSASSGSSETWAGTFDGGLVHLGSAPLTPADGLPEGRISPRALAVVGDLAFAGTPSGLLVVRERTASLVPVGGEVSAVAPSSQGGVWVGLPGRIARVAVSHLLSPVSSAVESPAQRSLVASGARIEESMP
jgi:ligand-binding sensor domain-containing protein